MPEGIAALALYAGLNGLILVWLSLNVSKVRMAEKIGMGDKGNPALIRAMRGQANFIENVPMTLVLILILAMIGVPVWVVHILGGSLALGRFLHAWHFTQSDAPGWQRMYGYIFTTLPLLGAIGGALFMGIWGLST